MRWRENATKLEPSLHFESCFSGIQLLFVDEPSPLACVAHNVFWETPGDKQRGACEGYKALLWWGINQKSARAFFPSDLR